MNIEELTERLTKYLEKYHNDFYKNIFKQKNNDYNIRVIRELQTRMKRLDEYIGLTKPFYGDIAIRKDLLVNPKMKVETEDEGLEALRWIFPLLEKADYSSLESLKGPILEAIASSGKTNGQILWPTRVALSGEEFSPGAFELAYILGRDESLRRLKNMLTNHS